MSRPGDTKDASATRSHAARAWRRASRRNTLLSLLFAAMVVLLINLWAAQLRARFDWSADGRFALSPQTEALLAGLDQPVEVLLFFQRGHPVQRDMEQLLRAYRFRSPLLRIESLDPDRAIARAEELAGTYGVQEPNGVLVRSGERYRMLRVRDLVELNFQAAGRQGRPVQGAFLGEQALSAAIYGVTQAEAPKVYMLAGHGERRPDNFDPVRGYSTIASRMRREQVDVQLLMTGTQSAIPADADALLIAGPMRPWSQPELDMVHAYLQAGGRAMLLVDAGVRSGLDTLLARWGVDLDDDVVLDRARTLTGREILVSEFGVHPVTDAIQGMSVMLHAPRPVGPLPGSDQVGLSADKPLVTVLASTTEEGWVERDQTQFPPRYDAGVDTAGPVPMAVAVERGPVAGIDMQIPPTRLLVVGDSAFVSNGGLTGGDADFFMSGLHWLLGQDDRLQIPPRPVRQLSVRLEARLLRQLGLGTVAGVPVGVALVGLLVCWRRTR
jgi:hypothetical protein